VIKAGYSDDYILSGTAAMDGEPYDKASDLCQKDQGPFIGLSGRFLMRVHTLGSIGPTQTSWSVIGAIS
jgi:hypothetical protein